MAVLVDGELVLYGFVGESYWGEGFTAREVLDALAELGRDADIVARINSGGGYVDEGIAIYNALAAHKGKVTVIVDAVAASSASVIAMAGTERVMRKGAMLMIHDPSGGGWGTSRDLERQAQALDKYAASMAGIYADASGSEVEDVREDMRAELWMTAAEAMDRGYATAVNDSKALAAAAHDYRIYAHAPNRLAALSKRRNWAHSSPQARASAPADTRHDQEDNTMTTETPADKNVADIAKATAEAATKANADTKARIKAITGCDEAKGRETLAQHLAFETDLPPEAAIATLKVAPTATAAPPSQSYEQRRLAAAGLAQPGSGQQVDGQNKSVLEAAVSRTNKRR